MLLFSLVGALVVALTLFASEKYQQEVNHKLNREVAVHIVNETRLIQDGKINKQDLESLFHSLMIFNPSLEIYFLDRDGWILSYSAPPWKVVRQSVDLGPIKDYLTNQDTITLTGDDPRNFDKKKVFSVAPIENAGQLEGYLYVILGGEEYDDILQMVKGSHILKLSLLIIVIGLVFALIFGVVIFAGLTLRLKKLSRAVNDFKQQGELNVSLMPRYRQDGDEIDRLTATFSEMANKIHFQLDNLQTTDNLRRELVANVSHDLRTPLATLQGYIETLLIKEDSLNREQRREYIQIAIKHCHRLNKLVMELFELAKLDAQETRPLMESFNLSELAHDITQKFLLAARKKKIRIQVNVGKGLPFVVADISLIERVLENLIENALRHTPEGGLVSLDLYTDEKGIVVEVSDTGNGIPKADIPYIFDRFHQLDKSRTSQDGGSGLGLAIVKRIVELHKSVIKVTSEAGNKTVFAFSLKESSL